MKEDIDTPLEVSDNCAAGGEAILPSRGKSNLVFLGNNNME